MKAAAPVSQPVAEPEAKKGPTPYSVWELKKAQYLAEKQRKADEAKRVVANQAREDIAKFYAMRQDRIIGIKQQNRNDEKATKIEIANLFQYGAQWEKVGKLMNLALKVNEKRPVERMRKLLVTLKNDTPAGGSQAGASAASAAAAAASPASRQPAGTKTDMKADKNG